MGLLTLLLLGVATGVGRRRQGLGLLLALLAAFASVSLVTGATPAPTGPRGAPVSKDPPQVQSINGGVSLT